MKKRLEIVIFPNQHVQWFYYEDDTPKQMIYIMFGERKWVMVLLRPSPMSNTSEYLTKYKASRIINAWKRDCEW